MGTIRQSHTPPGPVRVLFDELRRMHRLAGEPSVRGLARQIGPGVVSHATVHSALRGPRVPRWPVLELVVEQLGGDVEAVKQLWLAARDAEDIEDQPLATAASRSAGSAGAAAPGVRVGPAVDRDGKPALEVTAAADGSADTVLITTADQLAMVALFRNYFRPPPHYDPHPTSYSAAAHLLGWPRTTLVKRIEYLRIRLGKAGVANLTGFNALHYLAEFALAHRLLPPAVVEQFEQSVDRQRYESGN